MLRHTFGLLAILAALLGCARGSAAPSAPVIRLESSDSRPAVVEVAGLSRADLRALEALRLDSDEWTAVLRVTVSGQEAAAPAVAGRYTLDTSIRFAPAFPFEPGRQYDVSFDPSRLASRNPPALPATHAVVGLPAVIHIPSTIVAAVYPSGEVIPENQLRMYVQFSAPMGQDGGLGRIVLLDQQDHEIEDAILPLDTELWSGDRTRYTLLFDPGRVKREILPNRRMGRPLRAGETITLVVKSDWRDASGAPLKSEFRRQYRIGPPDERPLQPAGWRVSSPGVETRDALAVTFPEPLDRALLERAIAVVRGDTPIAGTFSVDDGETRWTFSPRDPWQPGEYALQVLPILEDLAGNRIGRAFEVRSPGDAVASEDARPTRLPFHVTAQGQ